jgi:hypothetical protein
VTVNGLSCPSAGNCTAGGTFTGGGRYAWGGTTPSVLNLRQPAAQAFVAGEADGTWGAARLPAASPGTKVSGLGGFGGLGSAANCVAAGVYDAGQSQSRLFVLAEVPAKHG